eukprot:Colp12_sorted_trinity150504_noHs@25330
MYKTKQPPQFYSLFLSDYSTMEVAQIALEEENGPPTAFNAGNATVAEILTSIDNIAQGQQAMLALLNNSNRDRWNRFCIAISLLVLVLAAWLYFLLHVFERKDWDTWLFSLVNNLLSTFADRVLAIIFKLS